MLVPIPLDLVVLQVVADCAAQARRLRRLTGVALPGGEAGRLWAEIQEHKWLLSERVGRDVGLRVAAVDYLENVRAPAPIRAAS